MPKIDKTMADAAELVAGVEFECQGYIPKGMITGLIGEPGDGKSAVAMGLLAKPVVTGTKWFNGSKGSGLPRNVLWVATENDMAITIQRMNNWKIPLERIVLPFDEVLKSANLGNSEDIELIKKKIKRLQIPLVVIDSLRGGHEDDENNSRVGHVLKSLSEIAEETKTAIVVVHHTKKLMVGEEVTANSSRGSNAILAMFRSQLGIDRPDPKSEWRRLRMLKENLGIAPPPIGFRVTATGVDTGSVPEKPKRHTEKDEAAEWLLNRMDSNKTYKASDLIAEAIQYGHTERTIRKAATERLGIKPQPVRDGNRISGWNWKLPKD